MKIWIRIVELVFPGTYEEYLQSKEIHKEEIKKYRTNPQYVLGILLFFGPLIALIFAADGWLIKIAAVSILIGEMFIRDTITEHFCAHINRSSARASNK